MTKQYVGFVRDHSLSMRGHAENARRDYNSNVDIVKENAALYSIDTIVSVVECGSQGATNIRDAVVNSSVNSLTPMASYPTDGSSTPLYDSVGRLIEIFKALPDYNSKDVSFLVMVITDGEENSSRSWKYTLADEISRLQHTDRWTFTFRVPKGYRNHLASQLHIPHGNVEEWEQTEKGWQETSTRNRAAVQDYYGARSLGQTSTKKFFTNIDASQMKTDLKKLQDVSAEIKSFTVTVKDTTRKSAKGTPGAEILPFVEKKTKKTYVKGATFYQLLKTERVQAAKQILIRNKAGKVYGGHSARDILNLPRGEEIKVFPGYHGDYDIFVQSTSVNRLLPVGTEVLIWPNVS